MCEDGTPGGEPDYVLSIGTDTPLGDDVIATINSSEELRDLVNKKPNIVRQVLIEIMMFLRTAAYPLEQLDSCVLKSDYDHAAEVVAERDAELLDRDAEIANYKARLDRLGEKVKALLPLHEEPAHIAALAETKLIKEERDALKLEVEALKLAGVQVSSDEPCSDPKHAEWYKDWKHEESEAAHFHGLYVKYFNDFAAEVKKADRYHIERENADADMTLIKKENTKYQKDLAQVEDDLSKSEEKADAFQTSLSALNREYKDVVSRLQLYDYSYQPYTIQRREGQPQRLPDAPIERSHRVTSPDQRSSRIDCRTLSPNTYPSRRSERGGTQEPESRRDRSPPRDHDRRKDNGRNRRDDSKRWDDNPLNINPHTFYPPPFDRATTPAVTVDPNASVSFKLPDIEAWKGNEGKNYEKWRRSAIIKCESLPEHQRLNYLEMKVDGAAWMYVDDLRFNSYLDLIEALDPYYSRSTFEKQADAQSKLTNGTLQMGAHEKYADWRGRFMAIHQLVKMSDAAMIGYACKYLRPSLAAGASHGFNDEEPGALLKFLDAVRRWDMTQKQINSGKLQVTKTTASAAKPRTRNDCTARDKNSRSDKREVATRMDWQKEALLKAKACFRCGDGSHQARDRTGCAVLPWAEVKTKLPAGLSAMQADYQAYVEDNDKQEGGQDTPEPELDDMGEPVDEDFQ
jgi:hypothetical protein